VTQHELYCDPPPSVCFSDDCRFASAGRAVIRITARCDVEDKDVVLLFKTAHSIANESSLLLGNADESGECGGG
jgi:hypothetical protein